MENMNDMILAFGGSRKEPKNINDNKHRYTQKLNEAQKLIGANTEPKVDSTISEYRKYHFNSDKISLLTDSIHEKTNTNNHIKHMIDGGTLNTRGSKTYVIKLNGKHFVNTKIDDNNFVTSEVVGNGNLKKLTPAQGKVITNDSSFNKRNFIQNDQSSINVEHYADDQPNKEE